ncbi:MAG: hypothetical protein ACD_50C00024G0004 [uncultured bacterium]|nr:MAG: hypothetical protein ACD_50C00024G0004 [uncultured bacterium]OGH13238.1 MAG: hypothetical protein A2687_03795 [Candidatus Levybacteria bacterium RIFCSPHIGHO2_01_FULL_38_26]
MREQEKRQYNQIESSGRRVEQEFPKNGDERLNALLGSFNMPTKAVVQQLLPYNGYISPDALVRDFREVFKGTELASFDSKSIISYCFNTLCPIGLVAQEYTIEYFGKDKLVGFGLTEAGAKYGIPAACLALYFENERKQSLYPTFGAIHKKNSEEQRTPHTRAKILWLLNECPNLTEKEVARELGINNSTVKNSLVALKNAGVIDYKSITPNTGKTQVTYTKGELPEAEVKKVGSRVSLTQDVVRFCEELINDGKDITQDAVFIKFPEEVRGKYKALRRDINITLSGLAHQEFLQRGQFIGGKIQSHAQITEKGKAIVSGFLTPLIGLLQEDNATRHWLEREIVPVVTRDLKAYAQNSGELYYPHSPSFLRKQFQENIGRLREILSVSSKPLTNVELSEIIGIHQSTVRAYLNKTLASELQIEERKGVCYYSMKTRRQDLLDSSLSPKASGESLEEYEI